MAELPITAYFSTAGEIVEVTYAPETVEMQLDGDTRSRTYAMYRIKVVVDGTIIEEGDPFFFDHDRIPDISDVIKSLAEGDPAADDFVKSIDPALIAHERSGNS